MAKKNRILAGVIGGMAGGIVMALGLYATSKVDLSRLPILGKLSDETDQYTFVGTSYGDGDDQSALAKSLFASAALGGIYGGLRSAFRLPGFLFGPVFGMTSYALNWLGLGQAAKKTPGPWNNRSNAILPHLVTHTVYGMVADQVSERVENALE